MVYSIHMIFFRYIIVRTLLDLLYAPVWWYTKGAVFIFQQLVRISLKTARQLAIRVWIQNLFTPMFQQYDWQGRLISFFMRILQIIFRTLFFLVLWCVYLLVFIAWFVVPLLIVYNLYDIIMNTYIPRSYGT